MAALFTTTTISTTTYRAARAHFFQLPPSLRAVAAAATAASVSVNQRSPPRRNFSPSTPRALDITQIAVAAPTAVLDGVHLLGIPWWAAIPISAALVRSTFVYVLYTRPIRKGEIVRSYIHPLARIRSRMRLQQDFGAIYWGERAEGGGKRLLIRKFTELYVALRESHVLGKRFGSPLLSWRNFVNFGTMLAFTEAIRVKCGTKEGLLSLIVSPFQSLVTGTPDAGGADKVVVSPAEMLAERLAAAYEARETQEAQQLQQQAASTSESLSIDDLLSDTPANVPLVGASHEHNIELPALDAPASTYLQQADPAMATEGLAWFQDLTQADPYHVLPFLLGATILARINWFPQQKKSIMEERAAALAKEERQSHASNRATATTPLMSETLPNTSKASHKARLDLDAQLRKQRTISDDIQQALAKADELHTKSQAAAAKGTLFRNFSQSDRFKLFMAALFSLIGLQLPAGILLYILTNAVVGRLQRGWLDRRYPMPQILEPCRRPMRIKVRRSFRGS